MSEKSIISILRKNVKNCCFIIHSELKIEDDLPYKNFDVQIKDYMNLNVTEII
ncbi:MAG TPA: hypothetical protein VLZ83_06320 [Edaphocola sp.]|nr:hypothetical protein [Edaphocola sp.]